MLALFTHSLIPLPPPEHRDAVVRPPCPHPFLLGLRRRRWTLCHLGQGLARGEQQRGPLVQGTLGIDRVGEFFFSHFAPRSNAFIHAPLYPHQTPTQLVELHCPELAAVLPLVAHHLPLGNSNGMGSNGRLNPWHPKRLLKQHWHGKDANNSDTEDEEEDEGDYPGDARERKEKRRWQARYRDCYGAQSMQAPLLTMLVPISNGKALEQPKRAAALPHSPRSQRRRRATREEKGWRGRRKKGQGTKNKRWVTAPEPPQWRPHLHALQATSANSTPTHPHYSNPLQHHVPGSHKPEEVLPPVPALCGAGHQHACLRPPILLRLRLRLPPQTPHKDSSSSHPCRRYHQRQRPDTGRLYRAHRPLYVLPFPLPIHHQPTHPPILPKNKDGMVYHSNYLLFLCRALFPHVGRHTILRLDNFRFKASARLGHDIAITVKEKEEGAEGTHTTHVFSSSIKESEAPHTTFITTDVTTLSLPPNKNDWSLPKGGIDCQMAEVSSLTHPPTPTHPLSPSHATKTTGSFPREGLKTQ